MDCDIVLGSDGFIGRHLVRYFQARTWPVFAVGRAAGDFTDAAVVERILGGAPKAQRLFHLITRQRTGAVQYQIQGEMLAINARIHLNVLEGWRRHQPQAKLISAGSSCVYPELGTPIPEAAFHAGPLHASVTGYGLAKQLICVGSKTYGDQYGLAWLHCILATVYGPKDHRAEDRAHFMTALIDRAVREKRQGAKYFTVWGDPNATRDLLYVEDQIEAILAADNAFQNTMINCAAGRPVAIGECARAIQDALDWHVPLYHPPESFGGVMHKSLDCRRFLSTTGWIPKMDLRAGICEVLARDYAGSIN